LNFPFFDFTFPNSYDLPAFLNQLPCYDFIPYFVALDFISPVLSVVRGINIAAIMTMPKATISKNHNSIFGKDKIWMPYKIRIPAPASYMMKPENFDQLNFRRFITF